jgi:tellurite methyltransferase
MNRSIEFFDTQFQRQIRDGDYALNPFEQLALPHLRGQVLDLGCGLGNLALAAAQRGCRVLALDASATAIADVQRRAAAGSLPVEARIADLRGALPAGPYDTVVSIGLLMFFDCASAAATLASLQSQVRPGGVAIVNLLVEGTTFLDMFDAGAGWCLWPAADFAARFAGWDLVAEEPATFAAPGDTVKVFSTIVARRPAAAG